MIRPMRGFGPRAWLVTGCLLWVAAVCAVHASAPPEAAARVVEENSGSAGNSAQEPAPTYVGDDTCLICHDDKRRPYISTPHGRSADARTPAARQGCETCHGPASRHVEDPGSVLPPVAFTKAPPREVNAVCTTCHNRGEHALWEGSQHESRGLACTNCHSVHAFKSATRQLDKAKQIELCADCHREKVSKVDRSGHMPVREGKLDCTTCHNPHGSTNVRLLRTGDSIADQCTSCHAEKRGPFLWEHAPTRDGCVTCHDPHGSSNERMLVTRPPILCQRCHVATRHPSTIYDAGLIGTSARVFARSCVTCHAAIHGSNHPSGQRFTR